MTELKTQRRLAAQILKCGENRVWLDPESMEDIARAITKEDIRALIEEGVIRKKRKKGISRGRWREKIKTEKKDRRKGHGSRKGKRGARESKKRRWIRKIRAMRDELKRLRDEGKIERTIYRKLYRLAKSGEIKSRRHLKEYIKKYELEQ